MSRGWSSLRRRAVAVQGDEVVEGLRVGLGLAVEMVEAGHQAGARAQAPGEVGVEVEVVGLQVLLEAVGVRDRSFERSVRKPRTVSRWVWVSARVVDQEPPPEGAVVAGDEVEPVLVQLGVARVVVGVERH